MVASMICRFNYTNRISIDKSAVTVRTFLPPHGGPILRIDKLTLPENGTEVHGEATWGAAVVVLEAWRIRTNSFYRREIGSVADIQKRPPPVFEDRLEEFEDEHQITFRLKVVSGDKILLAQADRLRSAEEIASGKAELIQVFPADIGEEVWRVDWNDIDSGPKVLVNKKLPNPGDFLISDPTVTALVLPSIIRDILYEIARGYTDYSQMEWCREWLDFVVRFYDRPVEENMDSNAVHAWVSDAVAAFSNAHKLCTGVAASFIESRKDEE